MTPEESVRLTDKVVELTHLLYFQQSHPSVKFATDPDLARYEPIRDETGAVVDDVEKLKDDAAARIAKSGLKAFICPLLRSTSHDISEIAKVVAASLLPLSLAHTIDLPLNPLIYAAIALLIFNSGVAAFCSEV
jgi:hypothetical protein